MYLFRATPCGRWAKCCAVCATALGLAAIAGCLPDNLSGDSSETEQVQGYNPGPPANPTGSQSPDSLTAEPPSTPAIGQTVSFDPAAPASHAEIEPNDTWEQAETLPFGGQLELTGTMTAGAMDVDIFEVGPGYAGQRLQADLFGNGADIQLGCFDARQRIIAYTDPLNPTAGPGRIDIVLHEATERLYVMLATRSVSTLARAYRVVVTLSAETTAPTSRPQAVVLVFGGANQVRIGSRPMVNVPPFDIAAINTDFAGQTEAAIELLMREVREDYAGLNVTFYRDTDPDRPVDGYTSIYFGTSDTRLLGLADNIDPFNGDPHQSAILYTDTFSLFNQLRPGFDSTVRVLANVTSHEAGHLLGLRHTADSRDLMDVTASARQMLADQYFKVADLHGSVLPFGVQDAGTMLAWSVGGQLAAPSLTKMYSRLKAVPAGGPDDFYIPRSLLADCGCSQCDLPKSN